MYHFRLGALGAVLTSAILLSACATSATEAEVQEEQRIAMQRWKACLTRHTDIQKSPIRQANRLIKQTCDGHKRDVIALFPPHMAPHVDRKLVTSGYRYIGSKHTAHANQAQIDQYNAIVLP